MNRAEGYEDNGESCAGWRIEYVADACRVTDDRAEKALDACGWSMAAAIAYLKDQQR